MNYSPSSEFSRLYLGPGVRDLPAVKRALPRLAGLEVREVAAKEDIPAEHRNRGTLFVTLPRGETVGYCPGTRGHVCCNYLTVDLYLGCTLGCSYCIMKSYLNFEPVTVYADPDPSIARIREIASLNPGAMVRVGSGETGDSLLLDPIFELSADFIRGLSDLSNVWFESKTKTDQVDHLLSIPDKGNAVIGFSLNPEAVFRDEEGFAATPDERLDAAARALDAGYLLAFHFDPVIDIPDWETAYSGVVDRLARFPGDRVAWISIGTFRYPPALKDRMEDRPYLRGEFVPCRDGKFRYLQRKRKRMYSFLKERLDTVLGSPVYLCMESADVWRGTMGSVPMKNPALRAIFRGTLGAGKTDSFPKL